MSWKSSHGTSKQRKRQVATAGVEDAKWGRLREAGPGRGARGHRAEELVSIPKAED